MEATSLRISGGGAGTISLIVCMAAKQGTNFSENNPGGKRNVREMIHELRPGAAMAVDSPARDFVCGKTHSYGQKPILYRAISQ